MSQIFQKKGSVFHRSRAASFSPVEHTRVSDDKAYARPFYHVQAQEAPPLVALLPATAFVPHARLS